MITGVSSKKATERMIKRAISLHGLLLCGCLLLMIFQLQAQSQVLRVAISDKDHPPYYFVDNNATLTGFTVETLQAIADKLNLKLKWQRMPWTRALNYVETGRADVTPVCYKTPEREKVFQFSYESYLTDPIVLLCVNPCPVTFDGTLASLGNEPVATVRHFSYGVELDKVPFQRADVVESDYMLFKLLLAERVRLVMTTGHAVTHSTLLQQAKDQIKVLQPALDEVDVYFAFNKKPGLAPGLRDQLDQALSTFKRSEHYQQLLAKYQLQLRRP